MSGSDSFVVGKIEVVSAKPYKAGDEDSVVKGQPQVLVSGGYVDVGWGDVIITDSDGRKRVRSQKDFAANYTPAEVVAEKLGVAGGGKDEAEAEKAKRAVETAGAELAERVKGLEAMVKKAKALIEAMKNPLAKSETKADAALVDRAEKLLQE